MTRMEQQAQPKPFWLDGNFAPVFEEQTAFDLKVTGNIPPELNGRYFRNGANPPSGKSHDWFLACGMIHGVELKHGKAIWYRNRYVQTALLEEDTPSPESRSKLENSIANTHIIGHAGKIFALAELSLPIEMSSELETVGPYRFDGHLNGNMTAHPRICPITGELLFFGYGLRPPFLTYYRASADGQLVQQEQIAVKGATMMHDFNITENYVIFMDLPMVWDFGERESGGLGVKFDPDYGARLGIMPRTGNNKDVIWFDIEPCYVYHTMNAYEAGDEIVLEGCRMVGYMAEGMTKPPLPKLHRWRMNLVTGSVREEQIDDLGVDFPRVPDHLVGQAHRYGYTAEFGQDAPTVDAFHKYDMHSGNKSSHYLKDGRTGSEAVFVPAANASNEDDGYLMSFVFDPAENKSELVIFDASNMANEPVARIHLPARVPAGFHGSWIASSGE
ncbi:MAG: carotenoid oxygenase family protein [Parasphingorhabdus sp.]|uniref:carotenoid oxygenase family protein n=1 Tax=Parasphingorhabdus sp. TaxID=2709688 RepID=UPI00329A4EDA